MLISLGFSLRLCCMYCAAACRRHCLGLGPRLGADREAVHEYIMSHTDGLRTADCQQLLSAVSQLFGTFIDSTLQNDQRVGRSACVVHPSAPPPLLWNSPPPHTPLWNTAQPQHHEAIAAQYKCRVQMGLNRVSRGVRSGLFHPAWEVLHKNRPRPPLHSVNRG